MCICTCLFLLSGNDILSQNSNPITASNNFELARLIDNAIQENHEYIGDTLSTQLAVINNSQGTIRLSVRLSTAEYSTAWIQYNGKIEEQHIGQYRNRSLVGDNNNHETFNLILDPNVLTKVKMISYNYTSKKVKLSSHVSSKAETYINSRLYARSNNIYFNFIFFGCVVIQLLFFGFLTFIIPRKEYVLYALYLLVVFLHYLLTVDSSLQTALVFPFNPKLNVQLNDLTLNLMYIMYIFFAYYFLNVSRYSLVLNRYLKVQAFFHFIVGLVLTTSFFVSNDFDWIQDTLYGLYLIAFILFLGSIYLINKYVPDNLKYFVIVGSICLGVFSLIELLADFGVLANVKAWVEEHNFRNYNITQFGILLEILVFSLGLGYKLNQAYKENESMQLQLIGELENNQSLQLDYNSKLEREVKLQTDALMKEKEKSIFVSYEKRITELQSDMRLAQMNPHFIFNGLNAIKYYAISRTKEETADYINDFSKLIRTILINSKKDFISLKEELEFIKLYLEVESKRLEGKFDFQLSIEEGISLDDIHIPPMMLQPMIENAILHGLLPKKIKGTLTISTKKEKDSIVISIIDNGIGRKASKANREDDVDRDGASLATILTKERINLLNDLGKTKMSLQTIDLETLEGESIGTQVEFSILN